MKRFALGGKFTVWCLSKKTQMICSIFFQADEAPAVRGCVRRAVLQQHVKGHSDVDGSGQILYLELTAGQRVPKNKSLMW